VTAAEMERRNVIKSRGRVCVSPERGAPHVITCVPRENTARIASLSASARMVVFAIRWTERVHVVKAG